MRKTKRNKRAYAATEVIKKVVIAAHMREALGQELCPSMWGSREPDKQALKAMGKIEGELSQLCEQMRTMDGFRTVLADDAHSDAIIVAVALLVAASLSREIRFSTVSALSATANGSGQN